jgi:hypothetical protein
MVAVARVSGDVGGRPHGGDQDAAIRVLRVVGDMYGIGGRVGVGNLDVAAGLEMLEGSSVDGAPVAKGPRETAKPIWIL